MKHFTVSITPLICEWLCSPAISQSETITTAVLAPSSDDMANDTFLKYYFWLKILKACQIEHEKDKGTQVLLEARLTGMYKPVWAS